MTRTKKCFFCPGKYTRPKLNVEVRPIQRECWKRFKQLHYLNTELNATAHCYAAFVNDQIAAFFAVLHFPHAKEKKFKKGHRLVVLPECQGLGLGHELSSRVAQMWKDKGYRFIITSNTKALYKQRKNDKRWVITRIGRASTYNLQNRKTCKELVKTGSSDRITISYEYIGCDKAQTTNI